MKGRTSSPAAQNVILWSCVLRSQLRVDHEGCIQLVPNLFPFSRLPSQAFQAEYSVFSRWQHPMRAESF